MDRPFNVEGLLGSNAHPETAGHSEAKFGGKELKESWGIIIHCFVEELMDSFQKIHRITSEVICNYYLPGKSFLE